MTNRLWTAALFPALFSRPGYDPVMTHRILLVEDDRKLAPLVQSFLEDHHFEVAWAADGDVGWREFERIEPDLVVLDLMLPGRDGLTLCRQIRAASRAGILILTAKGDET